MADAIAPPACGVDERRVALLAPSPPHVDLNGIDFVEVDAPTTGSSASASSSRCPPAAYGLPADPSRITIAGGTRIVGIRVLAASIESASVLRVDVDRGGDYSPYTLTLDTPGLDVVKRATTFSFMASCPSDVDCRPAPCPPPSPTSHCSTTSPRTMRASARCCSICCAAEPRLGRGQPGRPRHRAARAARLRG